VSNAIPASSPRVPVRLMTRDRNGQPARYAAVCQVDGCEWAHTSPVRAAVEEQARWHRSEHRRAASTLAEVS
jgi:hypothetical protein